MSDKALIKELQKRLSVQQVAEQAPKFDLRGYFFPKQFEFFRGTNKRFKVAVCSRRAGKTIGIVGDAIDLCLSERGVRVLYITLTRENCVEIIWPDLMKTIEEYKLECKINQQRLSVTFANGSVFSCAGAKDKREIGKFRGRKLRRIYIDEAQNFPTYLETMIEEDLIPTLRDLGGEMLVTGTPGPLKRGFFYDISTNGRWESHTWTAFQNPHMHNPPIRDLEVTLSEERAATGKDKNDPKYIRETYGVWQEDLDSLVFKFKAERNVAPAILPTNMTYIFGIDLGYNDADAIAVLGYSATTNKVYLVEERLERKQGITELVNQIEALRLKYDPVKMVMDAGGLGKKIQEEIQKRYTIPLEAADKNRKLEYIELLNDDLRTGRLQAYKGSQFEEDCYLVQWDRDSEDPSKLVISKSFHSDICDAVLYAWRECIHYVKQEKVTRQDKNTDSFMDALEAKEAEEMEARTSGHDDDWGVEQEALDGLFDDSGDDW
jgi:PBSX family phage terminase large subunit